MCEGVKAFFASPITDLNVGTTIANRLFYPLHCALEAIGGTGTVRGYEAYSSAHSLYDNRRAADDEDDTNLEFNKYGALKKRRPALLEGFSKEALTIVERHIKDVVVFSNEADATACCCPKLLKTIAIIIGIVICTLPAILVQSLTLAFSSNARYYHNLIIDRSAKKAKDDADAKAKATKEQAEAAAKAAKMAKVNEPAKKEHLAPPLHEILGGRADSTAAFNALPLLPGNDQNLDKRSGGGIVSEVVRLVEESVADREQKEKAAYPAPHLTQPIYRFEYEGVWNIYFRTQSTDGSYYSYILTQDADCTKVFIMCREGFRGQGAPPLGICSSAFVFPEIDLLRRLFKGEACGRLTWSSEWCLGEDRATTTTLVNPSR